MNKILENAIGKTVVRIEKTRTTITFTFNDGSVVSIHACGTEGRWLEIYND